MNRKKTKNYTKKFYEARRALAIASAKRLIPFLQSEYDFRSVADFGCADGVWLSVFAELGIEDYIGVDGPWIDPSSLQIPQDRFVTADFSESIPKLDRRFDLVSCIEVIEHIPDEQGKALIRKICNLSDVILFSAAVPFQGGVDHINEQRQSYWIQYFNECGFEPYDFFRSNTWSDHDVNVIYKQNMFVYINKQRVDLTSKFSQKFVSDISESDIIHPDLYEMRASNLSQLKHHQGFLRRVVQRLYRAWN